MRWIVAAGVMLGCAASVPAQDRMTAARHYMVDEYLVKEGISNRRVIEAMRAVERHEFVRRSLVLQAYFDAALPIGYKQTISPPFVVGYMTETIDPQPTDKVLEIGTGSGYQAAVLGKLAKEVYSIEIVEPLGKTAAARLRRLGYTNVNTKVGDGYKGWPEHAPFDKIIVTCSPEKVPLPLVEQLKEGGRMIIPLGERYQQVFHLLEKKNGKLERKKLIPTLFVPMTGVSEANREVKPDPANPVLVNGGFESDDNDDGRADNWHYQRQSSLRTESPPEGKQFIQFTNREEGRLAQALQGMAIDGRKVASLSLSMSVMHQGARAGARRYQRPAVVVHFYDSTRKTISETVIGPWLGNSAWKKESKVVAVPKLAREAIIRIGLNGGTGMLAIDNITMKSTAR